MTTLTHRDLGPDKRAAEMSDSDEAGHANGADLTAAKVAGRGRRTVIPSTAGTSTPGCRPAPRC